MTTILSPNNSGNNIKSLRSIQIFSLVTVAAVFLLMVLGGIVRVTDSGLGCPDWPLCYGKILPPLETTAIIEYEHRFVASVIVSPLILATAAITWVFFRKKLWLIIPSTLAIFLLIIQALLGAVTVLQELPGEIVAVHMLVSQSLLVTLILLCVVAFRGPLVVRSESLKGIKTDRLPVLLLISAIAVFVVIISGSVVTATGSTAACVTWPLCQGELFPKEFAEAIHMGHRLAVAVLGLFIIYVLHLGIRSKLYPKTVKVLSMGVTTVLMLQIVIGAGTVWSGFPASLLAMHLAMAILTLGAAASLAFITFTERVRLAQ
jgi:heme A synthase